MPGTVRVKFGGGHAGHNGLRSICDKLGTRDWSRVRVGIGRPPGRMPVVDWVLSLPKKEAADDFAYAVDRGAPGRALAGYGGHGEDPAGVQLGEAPILAALALVP